MTSHERHSAAAAIDRIRSPHLALAWYISMLYPARSHGSATSVESCVPKYATNIYFNAAAPARTRGVDAARQFASPIFSGKKILRYELMTFFASYRNVDGKLYCPIFPLSLSPHRKLLYFTNNIFAVKCQVEPNLWHSDMCVT